MALDFTALQTEVLARGFDFMSAGADLTRVKRVINEAMHETNSAEPWDYMFGSTTGVAPLTIADLDEVESVTDVAGYNPLVQVDRQQLVRDVADLTTAGYPAYWYKTAPTIIAIYPVSTTITLTVKYIKFGTDLSAGGDLPLMPDRWRQSIIELAVAKLWRDNNEWESVKGCMDEYKRLLDQMREKLVTQPTLMARTSYALDD